MGKTSLFSNITNLQADETAEMEGIELDFGDGRFITVARAGGSNRKYRAALAEAYKPHKMAHESGTMDNETAGEILRTVFSKTVVLDWRGWKNPANEEIPCTADVVEELFIEAPRIFEIVQEESERFANFARKEVEDSGNA